MTATPTSDYVIIEPIEEDQTTSSGILLPDSSQKKSQKGKVIAVGEGKLEDGRLIPVGVKENQVVAYKKYSGEEITIEGNKYVVVSGKDILVIL